MLAAHRGQKPQADEEAHRSCFADVGGWPSGVGSVRSSRGPYVVGPVRSRRGPVAAPLLAGRRGWCAGPRCGIASVSCRGPQISPMWGGAAQLLGRHAECDVLDRFLGAVRAGESRALVVRGEPGAGKTALLNYLDRRASGGRGAG